MYAHVQELRQYPSACDYHRWSKQRLAHNYNRVRICAGIKDVHIILPDVPLSTTGLLGLMECKAFEADCVVAPVLVRKWKLQSEYQRNVPSQVLGNGKRHLVAIVANTFSAKSPITVTILINFEPAFSSDRSPG